MSAHGTSVAVSRRYADAYLVAATIEGFGNTIKVIGIVIAVVLALASFSLARNALGVALAIAGIVIAGAIGTMLFVMGTFAAAHGQLLKATLDGAVNTSPFLDDPERARIMSLPAPSTSRAELAADWSCRCGQRNPARTLNCLECGVPAGA
ncbi:MAG TPA: hypothetical protein VEK79_14800 [Thermoanaerobaculia bacterium]|nr:hypothetical protein [Thermoanaerobaculia bacterium]